jgi:hypothetical protein
LIRDLPETAFRNQHISYLLYRRRHLVSESMLCDLLSCLTQAHPSRTEAQEGRGDAYKLPLYLELEVFRVRAAESNLVVAIPRASITSRFLLCVHFASLHSTPLHVSCPRSAVERDLAWWLEMGWDGMAWHSMGGGRGGGGKRLRAVIDLRKGRRGAGGLAVSRFGF